MFHRDHCNIMSFHCNIMEFSIWKRRTTTLQGSLSIAKHKENENYYYTVAVRTVLSRIEKSTKPQIRKKQVGYPAKDPGPHPADLNLVQTITSAP